MDTIKLNIYITNEENLDFARLLWVRMFTTNTSVMPRPHKGDDILIAGEHYEVITTVIRLNEFTIDVYVKLDN